jgi:hypothetical protein
LPWASTGSSSMFEGRLIGSVSSFAFMGTNGQTIVAGPATIAGAGERRTWKVEVVCKQLGR